LSQEQYVLAEQQNFNLAKPTGLKKPKNNQVNRRLAGREFNSSVAADDDETERQYG